MRSVLVVSVIAMLGCAQGGQVTPPSQPPRKPMAHPRVFIASNDILRLREKVKTPELKPRYEMMLRRCDRWLTMPPVKPPDVPSNEKSRAGGELWKSRMAQGRVTALSLAWLMTGERKYADRAKAELLCFMTEWKSWVDPFHGDASYYDLMSGEMCFTFGVAYDWLHDYFTPEERESVRKAMIDRALNQYLRFTDVEKNPKEVTYWYKSYANWNAVCNGGAIVSALALEGEYPEAGEIIARARRSMKGYFDSFPEDGGCIEGTGYWQYGMHYGAMGIEALRFAGKGDDGVFAKTSMKNTAYFPLYFCPRGIPVSFGDAGSPVTDSVFNLFGERYQNSDFVWYADAHCRDMNIESEGHPKEALEILWRPVGDQVETGVSALEHARVFKDIGWSIFVDRWPAPDVVGGFKCGNLGASHTQLDNNTFQVWGYGKWLAIDPGSGSYNAEYFGKKRWGFYEVATEGHNGLLIDGKGQKPKTRGAMSALAKDAHGSWVTGDATANYGDENVLSAVRHFVMIDRRMFLVIDVVKTKKPSTVETRLHTWAKPEDMGERVRVVDGKATLDLSIWSGAAHDIEILEDPGKGRTSMALKPEWVVSAMTPVAVEETVIASLLVPQKTGDVPVPALTADRKGRNILFHAGAFDVSLTWAEDGSRVESVAKAR